MKEGWGVGFSWRSLGVARGGGAGFSGILFVVVLTAGFAVFGLSGVGDRLFGGGSFSEALTQSGATVLGVWMAWLALVSLVLPVLALAVWGRYAGVRRALIPYVLVLVAQILVEMVFIGVFFPNIVVLTGLVFTVYRLGQLISARRVLAAAEDAGRYGRAVVGSLLSLGLLFWSSNLGFLVFVALPHVVGPA